MSMRRWRASRISVENRSTTATKLHPRTRPNRSPDLTMKLGVDHIGFQVEDVDAAVARIKNLGGKPLNDRHEVTPADPSKPQSRSDHEARRRPHRLSSRRCRCGGGAHQESRWKTAQRPPRSYTRGPVQTAVQI